MLTRQEIETGYPQELAAFADLLRDLTPEELATPTRCAGWTVADVGAHVAGGLADVTALNLEGAGTPEWTNRQVEERRGRSGADLAEEIDGLIKTVRELIAGFDDAGWNGPAPHDVAPSVGSGVEALFYDAYLHGDDIRAALGRPSVATGDGLRASVHHVVDLLGDRGFAGTIVDVDGVEELTVPGTGDGETRRITGPALDFVLVATGRRDPATLGLGPNVNVYGDS